ncbi:hypothetical protein [Defluviimonas sp. SAOS-178_SWC]|uniref:hypothetical protein n=1 Tax=Defluviimonas sp. SAOS-178_SWC TaxID=3121287 RepID=UPI003221697E
MRARAFLGSIGAFFAELAVGWVAFYASFVSATEFSGESSLADAVLGFKDDPEGYTVFLLICAAGVGLANAVASRLLTGKVRLLSTFVLAASVCALMGYAWGSFMYYAASV